MAEYDELARTAESAGHEIYWYGATSKEEVDRLESLLGVGLPVSFKKFLQSHGGGGIVSAEISGIESNDASLRNGGTVLGDTLDCRNRYGIPDDMIVIYYHDDEVCWCLDLSQSKGDEAPVVSYNVFDRAVDRRIAETFHDFMRQHLTLYSE